VLDLLTEYFGSGDVVSRGVLHDARVLPGFIAQVVDARVGLVQYLAQGEQWEVVVLISIIKRCGVGRRLLEAVQLKAIEMGCRRLWLVTTNDNKSAQRFYRAVGWQRAVVHRGAMQVSRRLKPEIPRIGQHGIPMEDEIEFEFLLNH
jgi:GNAT superfamily N-acetyltransferase